MTTAAATYDLPAPVTAVAACPVPDFERLIAAGGDDHLSLIGARSTDHLSLLPVGIAHAGPLDALAWGHDPAAAELRLAAASKATLTVHRIPQGGSGDSVSTAVDLEANARARSACFLQHSDKLALTGDGCACVVLTLDGSATSAANSRRVALGSPGVAVRTHAREPHQLMVAQEDGQIHFLDLRAPTARPSLARAVPLGDADAGGLFDADWSPHDPYLVGGVCGGRWLVWDLRIAGAAAPPQHAGDAQPGGATAFRFAPATPQTFATAGTGGELLVHGLATTPSLEASRHHFHVGIGALAPAPLRLGHDLPTRVSALAWLHVTMPSPMLVGSVDSKVCLWAATGGGGGGNGGVEQGYPQEPMRLL